MAGPLLATAIVSLLIFAFVFYPRISRPQAANQESQTITAILATTKQAFSDGNYAPLAENPDKGGEIMTQALGRSHRAGTPFVNAWGGAITLGATNSKQFVVTYHGVPSEPCSRLATSVGNNVERVVIKSAASPGDAKGANGKPIQVKSPMAPVDQTKTVSACGTNTTATIYFISN